MASDCIHSVYIANCCREKGIFEVESPLGLLEELFAHDPWSLLLSTIFLNRTRRTQVDTVLHDFLRLWPNSNCAASASSSQVASVLKPIGLNKKRAAAIIRFSREYNDLIALDIKNPMLVQSSSPFPTSSLNNSISDTTKELAGDIKHSCRRKLMFGSSSDSTTWKYVSSSASSLIPYTDPTSLHSQQGMHFTDNEVLSLYSCGKYALDAYNIFVKRKIISPSDNFLSSYMDYKRGRISIN